MIKKDIFKRYNIIIYFKNNVNELQMFFSAYSYEKFLSVSCTLTIKTIAYFPCGSKPEVKIEYEFQDINIQILNLEF